MCRVYLPPTPTTCFHHHVMDMLSPQSQLVFHDTTTLDPAERMLDPNSDAVNATIAFLFFWSQCATTRLPRVLGSRSRDRSI